MNVPIKSDKYIFNPGSKQVTFVGLSQVFLQGIYAIYNTTSNICIYDFGDPTLGGTLSGNVLTLTYNTAAMSATDALLIKYDDGNVLGVDIATKVQDDNAALLRRIVKLLEASGNVDSGNRQRVVLDAITAALTLATVSTVTTVSTLTTVTNPVPVGNVATMVGWDQRMFADQSRINYNTGLRNRLTFS